MSGSGKGLIGLWLYRHAEEWMMKDGAKNGKNEQNGEVSSNIAKEPEVIMPSNNSIVFSLKNQVGDLATALDVLKEQGVNVVHIESRKNKRRNSEYEILVDIQYENSKMDQLTDVLQKNINCLSLHDYDKGRHFPKKKLQVEESFDFGDMCPWFPRRIADLDNFQTVLMYGSDLDADHPAFTDPIYRERRKYFYDTAMNYKFGQPIPRVTYTAEEIQTWGTIFRKLHSLYPKYACKEYNKNWPMLVSKCGYKEDNIPQLADIDKFLRGKTGFCLRPVAGYLSPRDFLAGLAFRVFHCTQYIRHPSDSFYTPEPDCCHELLGHMPLLACPVFAQFSQEIGLASLGANDEDLSKIATLYFFTVEFGLCKEDGNLRVYGAGLLSSAAELEYSISGKSMVESFNPDKVCKVPCLVTTFQDQYFYSNTFEEAKEQLRTFVGGIARPFGIRFNPYTQSVEILSNAQKIAAIVSELKGDLCIVRNAMQKIQETADDNEVEGLKTMLTTAFQQAEK